MGNNGKKDKKFSKTLKITGLVDVNVWHRDMKYISVSNCLEFMTLQTLHFTLVQIFISLSEHEQVSKVYSKFKDSKTMNSGERLRVMQ